ncbi:MAG TPA: glycoside hydrolase family 16 protein [Propionibacteriaceae bacterium]|nr:glycoside hydrolase family 16 protein [Propionibacteriaceae bacterium]
MGSIRFSGYDWLIKESATKVGPGPNVFSAANVVVDEGGLQLRIAELDAGWACAEVIAQGAFGYGTYTWVVASELTQLDPAVVLGLFTWSDIPDHAHREIDIEFARWGADPVPGASHGWFTVQAGTSDSFGFAFPPAQPSVHGFVWTPERVTFTSTADGSVSTWSYSGTDVPLPGGGVTPRINVWLYQGAPPAGAQTITVESFVFMGG